MEKLEKIKIPDKIVTHVKNINREIDRIAIPDDIDFMGCSGSYVIGKIEMAMHGLKWYKERIEEVLFKRRKSIPAVFAQWDISLSLNCPHCDKYISNVLDTPDLWDGNNDIDLCGENKYRRMVFECPHCEKEIIITDFEY